MPIATIQDRAAAEKAAARAISVARCKLLLDSDASATFYATLGMRLRPVPDWGAETLATDGRLLLFNPEYVMGLSKKERIGVICHEVMHVANAHHARLGGRDPKTANIAMDLAINPPLKNAGYALPAGAIFPRDFGLPDGLAFEEYYVRLRQQQARQQPKPKPGDGEPQAGQGNSDDEGQGDAQGDSQGQGKPQAGKDPGKCGAVVPAGDAAECEAAEAEVQVAVAQAVAAAKQRGELPGWLSEFVGSILEPEVPWEAQLREFLSKTFDARDDYSWEMPDRNYVGSGLYLPALRSQSIGHILVHVDCSGSTGPFMDRFGGELQGVLSVNPCKVTILYGDTELHGEPVEWSPTDGDDLTNERRGGGGTDHRHLAEYVRGCDEEIAAVVALTDGFTCWPDDYGVPTLWCITPDGDTDVPFGQVVRLK